ncbi:MAG TPA: NrpR regulatory domain-containing protein [Dehalococcoidia bacterium]|nr:NrpR regulatory domain-containing protein [Dehalococcoidia bacterium]
MIGQDRVEVERKIISILRVLRDSPELVGARVIARRLKGHGVELGERAVRYHLKIMDERGLTQLVGRDGRVLTPLGEEELQNALVGDKVGFVISKIESLAFRTTFDCKSRTGLVPMNISLFLRSDFKKALPAMKEAFEAGLCVSPLVAVAQGGKRLGDVMVPQGQVGFASVCSIVVNGCLLKVGIPMDSRFGGLLQIRDRKPYRFAELVEYSGSSLDPSEIFITSRMTSVLEVARKGEGKLLANFREVPALCRPLAEEVVVGLRKAGLGGLLVTGEVSEPCCQIPVGLNKVGVVLLGGLNPVAAAVESGIEVHNFAMSGVIDYKDLVNFREL